VAPRSFLGSALNSPSSSLTVDHLAGAEHLGDEEAAGVGSVAEGAGLWARVLFPELYGGIP